MLFLKLYIYALQYFILKIKHHYLDEIDIYKTNIHLQITGNIEIFTSPLCINAIQKLVFY